MLVGLILALASAVATNLAFLFKHRGAVLAPPILVRHPLRSAVGLFRSRWFLVGWLVAVVAWGLHVGALSLAPLSIVQAVLSGGLVFLAVFAERFFGFHLGRRQWVGVTITAAGLVVIGLTGGGANDPERASLAALIAIPWALWSASKATTAPSTARASRPWVVVRNTMSRPESTKFAWLPVEGDDGYTYWLTPVVVREKLLPKVTRGGFEDDQELVATHPGDQVLRSQHRVPRARGRLQQPIAGGVPSPKLPLPLSSPS